MDGKDIGAGGAVGNDTGAKKRRASGSGDTPKVGGRIRELRQQQKMTLADLAAASGISIGTLSQIERELVSPTVRTLFTLGEALGVSAAWLLDPESDEKKVDPYVVTADRRQPFLRSEGLKKDLISPASSDRLRGFYMLLEPGYGSGGAPYAHNGEEIGLVLSGVMELEIEGENWILREGDCFAFPSDLPHRFANIGATQCAVFWINADI